MRRSPETKGPQPLAWAEEKQFDFELRAHGEVNERTRGGGLTEAGGSFSFRLSQHHPLLQENSQEILRFHDLFTCTSAA